MEKLACLYFEGNDSKIALFETEGGNVKLVKADSIDTSLAFGEQNIAAPTSRGASGQHEIYTYDVVADETSTLTKTLLQKLHDFFLGEDLAKCRFIPVLTEPAVYFQKVSDKKDFALPHGNGSGKIRPVVDFVDLYDQAKLAVYPSGKSSYLQVMDSLARLSGKRVLRIPAVKCAEISLASYIARKKTLREDETSLIMYIGKEYSKLIFLRGSKLFHVGSTLSVGKNSFDAHNVIVRKILLEMEHVSLGKVQNIILCGEDTSAQLIAVLSEAYSRTKVSVQAVDPVEIRGVTGTENSFIVPTAVAEEYLAELQKKYRGINLLPQYVKEEQKLVHLGWEGYALIALILLSTGFFSTRIASTAAHIQAKDQEIIRITAVLDQNRAMLEKIKRLEARITNADQTRAVLRQLSAGTGILSGQVKKLSNFTRNKGNLWITQVGIDQSRKLTLGGYTFSRPVVKQLSDSYDGALLQNITFDPLRNTRVFKFLVNADLNNNETKK